MKSGGTGVFGLLGIVFVTLKLTGVINWSWWYVTLPFWGGLALVGVIGLFMLLVFGGIACIDEYTRSKKRRTK